MESELHTQWDKVLVDIVEYVFHYEIQSPRAWSQCHTALLDSLGCAIESISSSAECRRMLGPVVPGTVTPNGFRLPGTPYQLDPIKGAFDLGTAIRYMDHNDTMGGADWGHPSDNIGALLAVADWVCRSVHSGELVHNGPPLTLRTLRTSIIKAYDVQGCFLTRNSFNSLGLDHVILVKLASAALVSWLIGLSEAQTLAVLSHVWMDGGVLRIYRSGSNTIPRKGWAAGDACARAVQLALLVRSGQPGAPTVLTMPRWGFYDTIWRSGEFKLPWAFGTRSIENIFFKVMAVEGHSISAIEATLIQLTELRARGQDVESQIVRVDVRTNGAANMIINKTGHLRNAADRDHCMQYALAVVLLKGAPPTPEDFQDSSPYAKSSAVQLLRERIFVREVEQFTKDYLDVEKKSVPSAVSMELASGELLKEVIVEYPVGHVKNFRTREEVRMKLIRNLSLMFNSAEIKNIIKAVEDEDGMSISNFVDLFVRPGDTTVVRTGDKPSMMDRDDTWRKSSPKL